MKKDKLLKECVEVMKKPHVEKWYSTNMEKQSQSESITKLEQAVINHDLVLHDALCLALVVGYQWDVKFEGTP